MMVETKRSIGDAITVLIDGSRHIGRVKEIRVIATKENPEPIVAYAAVVGSKRLDTKGKEYVATREWIGKDEDIVG